MAITVSARRTRDRNTVDSRADLVPGTYRPGSSTTGVLPGTVLTTYSGATTITTAGTTISNKEIFASLDIQAANVTIDNCKIRATTGASYVVSATNAAASNTVITNCEVFPDVPSHNYNGIQGHGLTVKYCNIHDTVDGVNLFYANTANNSVIMQNWIHDMAYFTPDSNHADNQTHNDGIQIQGSKGPILIQGNFIDARGYSAVSGSLGSLPDRGTGDDTNGRHNFGALTCIQFTDAPVNVYTISTPAAQVKVLDNYLYGAYRSLAAGSADSDLGIWWRNRFDDTQGLRDSLSTKTGVCITVDALVTVDAGEGTSNANVYVADGSEVLVRRNG